MYKYAVFDKKQHMITKLSPQVSIYTYQKFTWGQTSDQRDVTPLRTAPDKEECRK